MSHGLLPLSCSGHLQLSYGPDNGTLLGAKEIRTSGLGSGFGKLGFMKFQGDNNNIQQPKMGNNNLSQVFFTGTKKHGEVKFEGCSPRITGEFGRSTMYGWTL